MSKVLGNDPFLRGAAPRPPETEAVRPVVADPPAPTPARSPRKATRSAARGVSRNSTPPPARPRRDRVAKAAAFTVPENLPPPPAHDPSPLPAQVLERHAQAVQPSKLAPVDPPRATAVARLSTAMQGLWGAVKSGAGLAARGELDEYGKDDELGRQLAPVASFFYDQYWRVSTEGAAQLPSGPFLLVANHSGAVPVDGAILHHALGRERPDLPEARWLAEDQIFYAPFIGTLINRLGAVRACPENAIRLLSQGSPVIVFPEGIQGIGKPFAHRYQLQRLGRGGFAKLAVRARVPIVPVAVVGAEEALPLLGKLPGKFLGLPYLPLTPLPLPAKWHIRFGDPIAPTSGSEAPAEVQRLVDQTRESIEGMMQSLLNQRTSIFA